MRNIPIMRQFAAGRPDEDDRAELEGFAEQIQRSLLDQTAGNLLCREISLIGSMGSSDEAGGLKGMYKVRHLRGHVR